jgi:hypothetical protein
MTETISTSPHPDHGKVRLVRPGKRPGSLPTTRHPRTVHLARPGQLFVECASKAQGLPIHEDLATLDTSLLLGDTPSTVEWDSGVAAITQALTERSIPPRFLCVCCFAHHGLLLHYDLAYASTTGIQPSPWRYGVGYRLTSDQMGVIAHAVHPPDQLEAAEPLADGGVASHWVSLTADDAGMIAGLVAVNKDVDSQHGVNHGGIHGNFGRLWALFPLEHYRMWLSRQDPAWPWPVDREGGQVINQVRRLFPRVLFDAWARRGDPEESIRRQWYDPQYVS